MSMWSKDPSPKLRNTTNGESTLISKRQGGGPMSYSRLFQPKERTNWPKSLNTSFMFNSVLKSFSVTSRRLFEFFCRMRLFVKASQCYPKYVEIESTYNARHTDYFPWVSTHFINFNDRKTCFAFRHLEKVLEVDYPHWHLTISHTQNLLIAAQYLPFRWLF